MIIAIDPGLSKPPGGTGYAVFQSGDKLLPEKTGNLTSRLLTWEDRAIHLVSQVREILLPYRLGLPGFPKSKGPSIVYIELPTFFQSDKGMMCATGKRGNKTDTKDNDSDLVKLSYLVGLYAQVARELEFKVILIRVNDWKGNLKKPVVTRRIATRLGLTVKELGFSSHAIDAVGIGLHAKGKFKANTGVNSNARTGGNIRRLRPKPTRVNRASSTRRTNTSNKRSRPNNQVKRTLSR